ncbi:helix-turn-helix transcriptional regulator [Pseudonocardia xinjiangensis]|uniref:helix-turn-helix transcriptional regulator n=1 Tax=Pseudonocardia xinjiangensis TaxID=75289 RepID=UPI0028A93E08|nr:AAA family ATPase [Pseudonocardia xinjiangensis]
MLLDRRSEREVLDRVVADLRRGESRALVLRGDAGIGKTALLEYVVGQAAGCQVVRAGGNEAEDELAFAGLEQVCAPMLDRSARLPGPQREALSTAFGLSAGRPPDRFMVGLAVLSLFAETARERPLLCLIDDAQWLDRASAQVLGFVARRLKAESLAMIFAMRGSGDQAELAGLPELHVTGLPDDDARALLLSAHPGPVDDRVLDRVVADSRGNPLALQELPRGFTLAELAGGFGLLSSAALPYRIEESFRRQIAALAPLTRQVLLVAAAEPVGDPVLVWRAVDPLGIGMGAERALREAAAGFLEFGARVTFRHPLLRSAIYHAATPEDRRQAHRALARVMDPVTDPDRRAWHLAQAAAGFDDDVAAELEQSAGRAQARGGPAAAAAFFERAADLTRDSARRGQRLLAASQANYQAGMPHASLPLLARAEACPLGALERANVDLLRARVAFTLNRGPEAPTLLLRAAARLEKLDARMARETYLEALRAGWFVAHLSAGPHLHDLSAAALEAPAAECPGSPSDLLLDGLAVRYRDGYPAGAPLLKQALDAFLGAEPAAETDLRWLWFACTTALDLWQAEAGDVLTSRFVQLARNSGALTALPLALTQRVVMQVFAGDLAAADLLLEEFDAVREGTGLDEPPYAAQLLAVWRGQEEKAAALIGATTREATQRGEGVGVVAAGWMQALLLNSLGRYDEALPAARQATEPRQEMGVLTWCSLVELVIAAARTGHGGTASEALARLRVMTQASGTDWALGLQASCEALVRFGEAAEPHHREAIDRFGRTRMRGGLARCHLHYGEWLRRSDRYQEAREELRTAHTMFTAMGMDAFAARSARELGASGETVRKNSDVSSGQLTVQQEQIVRLVRDGLSNAEIAARLFISPRTVEWHLSKVFIKCGVTSRRQLRS